MAEEIRAFLLEHLDDCARIMVTVSNRDPWNEDWTEETARTRLWEIVNTPGFIGLVYWKDGVAGYAMGCCEQWDRRKNFCLYEIAVAPEMQRQGIGGKLLACLETILTDKDVDKIYLSTMRNSNAEEFYLKQGYHASKNVVMMLRYLG